MVNLESRSSKKRRGADEEGAIQSVVDDASQNVAAKLSIVGKLFADPARGMSLRKVSYEAFVFSVFSRNQE